MTVDPANVVTAAILALIGTWKYVIPAVAERRERAAAPQAGAMIPKATNGSAGGQSKEWWQLYFQDLWRENNKELTEFLGGKMDTQGEKIDAQTTAIGGKIDAQTTAIRDLTTALIEGRRRGR